MLDDFDKLLILEQNAKKKYSHFNIGKTEWGQNILCYVLGDAESEKSILLHGTIHAREYISSFVLYKMMDYLSHFYIPCKLYFIPLVNKDGAMLCIKKNLLFSQKNHEKIEKNYNFVKNIDKNDVKLAKRLLSRYDMNLLKSNAKGVDLNVNFDCDWGEGKHNFFSYPSYQNFIGTRPCCSKENKCLIRATKNLRPSLTLSFHSRGEVFYYGYKGESKPLKQIEKVYKTIIKKSTKYKAIFTKGSTGGYKDWCITKLSIPSFTIELAPDSIPHPISSIHTDIIFAKVKSLVLDLSKSLE